MSILLSHRASKYVKTHFYAMCAFVIVLAATLLRVVLIALAPALFYDNDEATLNLAALHIAYHGEHPIFFYGQNYMGTLEAYIGAGLFRLFGPSIFTMRLGLVLLSALFLTFMYLLTSLLYNERFALFVLILLSLGTTPIIKQQLRAVGGYPETLLFGALLCFIVCRLALFRDRDAVRKRIVLYTGWGLVVGLALWSDMLILPFVFATGLLLLLVCWRDLFRYGIYFLLLGLLIAGIPLISYNLSALPGQDSLSVLLAASNAGYFGQHIPLLKFVVGALFISLPYITGIYPGCGAAAFPFYSQEPHQRVLKCLVLQGGWGLSYMLLFAIALFLTIALLWKLRLVAADNGGYEGASFERSQEQTRQLARLMLLVAAFLTLAIYMHSPTSALEPSTSARYLIGLLIATPALLWPLWNGGKELMQLPLQIERVVMCIRVALLLTLLLLFALGTINIFRNDVPAAQRFAQLQKGLADDLQRIGATRIYTDYWTCHRLVFESKESIICSAVTGDLKQDSDRYPPYRRILRSTPNPTYVFPIGSAQATALEALLQKLHQSYEHWTFDGYVVYKPAGHVQVPHT